MDIPKGTEITAHSTYDTDERSETDYGVIERVPPAPALSSAPYDDDFLPIAFLAEGRIGHYRDSDLREVALRIDTKSVEVHRVDWVNYNCTTYAVQRYRYEKHEPEF